VSSFVIAYFADAIVCDVREAGCNECTGVKALKALLVKGVYRPFCAEKILEQEVVGARIAFGGG
jgi:hypothetical protein